MPTNGDILNFDLCDLVGQIKNLCIMSCPLGELVQFRGYIFVMCGFLNQAVSEIWVCGWLDEGMNMQMYVKMMCKAANSSLYMIGRIRKHLDQRSTERLIHAFISSRLDCNNGLLYGLPQNLLDLTALRLSIVSIYHKISKVKTN
jgi:hypothetical protein